MSCSWLKELREAAGLKQAALALAAELDVRVLGRLERCEKETPTQVPYERLASVLNGYLAEGRKVCPVQLAEHHALDLDDAKLPEHAKRARDQADQLRRAKYFQIIDSGPIQAALTGCRPTGLIARIAERAADLGANLPDEEAQAKNIAQRLGGDNLNGLASLLNKPLQETIASAADGKALDDLARFLRTVVRACAADDPSLKVTASAIPERWHQHHGESKTWPFVAMIDRSVGLDGMRLIQSPAGNVPRLDEASIRAVRSGRVTQTSVDGRLYELVGAFADLLAYDGDKPAPGDAPAFAQFCDEVNQMLWDLNYVDEHVFGLWERANCEPGEVKQQLLQRLPRLRLFDCGDPDRASSVLRVNGKDLETWFALRLKAIADRRKTIATTPRHATQSTAKPEQTSMKEAQSSQSTVVIVNTGNGPVNQASGNARAHQYNLSPPQDELLPLLSQLLSETGTAEPRYADLRKACREAQGELEENSALTAPTKNWLQRTIEALPAADKAVDVAAKVADLIGRLPGVGT